MIYPAIAAYTSEWLDTGDGHQIYVEQSGAENGIPVLYLHGGPGGGSSPLFRSLFDPERYRIIVFDQRGCGQSKPFATYKNNTTDDLLADIELIRDYLNIDKWVVAGGSWGTTLGLLYAQAHPQRVKSLILRGVFLSRQQDFDWLYQPNGAARLFPEHYQDFIAPIAGKTDNLFADYWALLTSGNELQQLAAAKAWCLWEARISRLQFDQSKEHEITEKHAALPQALLECHYFLNNSFIADNQILRDIDKIAHIPATIIHGRYDSVCDLSQAYQLSQAWPASQLLIVPAAGHSLGEVKIAHAFVQASSAMADYIEEQQS